MAGETDPSSIHRLQDPDAEVTLHLRTILAGLLDRAVRCEGVHAEGTSGYLKIDPLDTIDDVLGAMRVRCCRWHGRQPTWGRWCNHGHLEVPKDLLGDGRRPNVLTEGVKEALRIIPAEQLLYECSESGDVRGLRLSNSRKGRRSTDHRVDVRHHNALLGEGFSHTGGKLRMTTTNLPGQIMGEVVVNSIPPACQDILCASGRAGGIAECQCKCAAHDAQCSALSTALEALLHASQTSAAARHEQDA